MNNGRALVVGVLTLGLIPSAFGGDDPVKPSTNNDSSQRMVVVNSRVLLLIDTSASMGLVDAVPDRPGFRSSRLQELSDAVPDRAGAGSSRLKQLADFLEKSEFLDRMRRKHDVAVYQFDETLRRVVVLSKQPEPGDGSKPRSAGEFIRWRELLVPQGTETRLGDAVAELLEAERDSPVSAIILCSDGRQNAGTRVEAAVGRAREAKIPIVTIGVGSDRRAPNVGLVHLSVPPEVFLGDRFSIVGYLRADAMPKRAVTVDLLSLESGGFEFYEKEATARVELGGDGEITPVRFQLTAERPGRRIYYLPVKAPKDDADSTDNFRKATVQIAQRANRVLLFAGGPTREYRYLTTQLVRDRRYHVDVLLQTAQPRTSQDANQILEGFPETREEMSEYDCVVAIDPDWQRLARYQRELLETWVREHAGGLLLIAGPIHMGSDPSSWLHDESMQKIRSLFPVEFLVPDAISSDDDELNAKPKPIRFTMTGRTAEFLWLDESAASNSLAWFDFEGVYSCFPVRTAKENASVLAHVSGLEPAATDVPYFVTQFHGSGRVFYAGSGEMWRLRSTDVTYFERYYAGLIRYLASGRHERAAGRDVLLVGQDRAPVGQNVTVAANLTNARCEPLEREHVLLAVIPKIGPPRQVRLDAVVNHPGFFAGKITLLENGEHRLELPLPDSDDERLVQEVSAFVPQLEFDFATRNDPLLHAIAAETGGSYFVGLDSLVEPEVQKRILELLKDRSQIFLKPNQSDRKRR